MTTVLPDNIYPKNGEIHIIYSLKMGEKYKELNLRHFKMVVIHEFDLRHEELLACYADKWIKTIEEICKINRHN